MRVRVQLLVTLFPDLEFGFNRAGSFNSVPFIRNKESGLYLKT